MDLSLWPQLHKCCCCISLRVGAMLVGCVSVLISLLSLSGVTFSLYKVVSFVAQHAGRPDAHGHSPEQVARTALGLYIAHAYFMLVLLYYLAISTLLLVGLARRKTNYLRYYFNAALVLLVLALASVAITAVFFGIVATIPLLKWCLFLFYCLVVVRSAYLQMEQQREPPAYELKTIDSAQRHLQTPLI